MHLIAFKNFYFGYDIESYFDVSVHLGNFVLECGSHFPTGNESLKKGGHQHGSSPSTGGDRGDTHS